MNGAIVSGLSNRGGQRAALDRFLADLTTEGAALGGLVQAVCREILHYMKGEEHDLLHPISGATIRSPSNSAADRTFYATVQQMPPMQTRRPSV